VCVCVGTVDERLRAAENSGPAGWPIGGGKEETTLPPL